MACFVILFPNPVAALSDGDVAPESTNDVASHLVQGYVDVVKFEGWVFEIRRSG
jgi:hypothetical protein